MRSTTLRCDRAGVFVGVQNMPCSVPRFDPQHVICDWHGVPEPWWCMKPVIFELTWTLKVLQCIDQVCATNCGVPVANGLPSCVHCKQIIGRCRRAFRHTHAYVIIKPHDAVRTCYSPTMWHLLKASRHPMCVTKDVWCTSRTSPSVIRTFADTSMWTAKYLILTMYGRTLSPKHTSRFKFSLNLT